MRWDLTESGNLKSRCGRFLIVPNIATTVKGHTVRLVALGDHLISVPSGKWPYIACKSIRHAQKIAKQQEPQQ